MKLLNKFETVLLNDNSPSHFFRNLYKAGLLKEHFPEMFILTKVMQKGNFHPEGTAFEHTMQALDAAAETPYETLEEKRILALATLCHDYGKFKSLFSGGDMMGHDVAGIPPTKNFLKRFCYGQNIVDLVCKLVLFHKKTFEIFNDPPDMIVYEHIKSCFDDKFSLKLLMNLFWADLRGRNGATAKPLSKGYALKQILKIDYKLQSFVNNIKTMEFEHGPEIPVLCLEDLSQELFLEAYRLQVDQGITDKHLLRSLV